MICSISIQKHYDPISIIFIQIRPINDYWTISEYSSHKGNSRIYTHNKMDMDESQNGILSERAANVDASQIKKGKARRS